MFSTHSETKSPFDRYRWAPKLGSPDAVNLFTKLANGNAIVLHDGGVLRARPVDPDVDQHHGTLTLDLGHERYRAKLRDGARWHEGQPLRVRDVVALHCGVAA